MKVNAEVENGKPETNGTGGGSKDSKKSDKRHGMNLHNSDELADSSELAEVELLKISNTTKQMNSN